MPTEQTAKDEAASRRTTPHEESLAKGAEINWLTDELNRIEPAASKMLAALKAARVFVGQSVELRRGDYPAARLGSDLFDAIAAAEKAGIKAGG